MCLGKLSFIGVSANEYVCKDEWEVVWHGTWQVTQWICTTLRAKYVFLAII